jgi:hypothetical protein
LYNRRSVSIAFRQIPLVVCIAWRKADIYDLEQVQVSTDHLKE